jgi:hypothetical protein
VLSRRYTELLDRRVELLERNRLSKKTSYFFPMFVKKLLRLARHLEQKPSTPKGFAHAAGIADFVRCLRNAAAELECADWSSSSTFVIRDARSEVRAGSRAYGGGGTIMHEV